MASIQWSGSCWKTSTEFRPAAYSVQLPTAWIENGAVAYIALADESGTDYSSLRLTSVPVIEMQLAATATQSGAFTGPSLTSDLEEDLTITLVHASAGTLVLDGPAASDVAFQDTNEPYTWFYSTGGVKSLGDIGLVQ